VREDLLESPPSDFLQTLTLAWTDHKISLVIMRDILSHMERVYVPQHGVEDVYGLGLTLFRDHVIKYGEIKEQLKEALSDTVARERRGEAVDRSMIRDITTMLAMLGGHIYKRVFEDPFLQQAVEFYRAKSRNFLEGGSSVREEESRTNVEKEGAIQEAEDDSRCDHMETIVEEENQRPPLESTASDIQPYIRHVRSWTEREARRASRYGVGKCALRRAMTDALILDNLDAIVAATVAPKPPSFPALQRESPEIARMLRDGSAEELRSRYDLHSSVPEGSNITAKCVSAYLRERGRALVAEAEGPVSHVQSLLDLKHQLDGLLRSSFRGDRVVEQAVARDFHHLLGLDPRSAERLSLFIDHAMRGARGMTEPEIRKVMDGTMALFRFLPEKDAFQRFYEKHLAERLLLESVSEETERSMVSRLKTECGSQFTAKLEGMLQGMAVSKAIAKELKHRVDAAGVSASQSNLFTVALWGIASVDGVVLRAGRSAGVGPDGGILAGSVCRLRVRHPCRSSHSLPGIPFYLSHHSGRKLTLQPQLGSANIYAPFFGPRREDGEAGDGGSSFARLGSRRPSPGSALSSARPDGGSVGTWGGEVGRARHHVIQMSTFQVCILMLFNDRSRISYASLTLGKATQRILNKSPKTRDIEPNDVFAINDSFTSKLFRVEIHSTKGKSDHKRIESSSQADEDEQQEIEATNIHHESCKKPPHNPLTTEVREQRKVRLLPRPVALEKRI
ncbi:unnamed protein product, partial [Darwinula stevensoni]